MYKLYLWANTGLKHERYNERRCQRERTLSIGTRENTALDAQAHNSNKYMQVEQTFASKEDGFQKYTEHICTTAKQ